MIWQLIVIGIIAYLLGSVNLSILLCKAMGKGDIRDYGSGNAGTTNSIRTMGKTWGAIVFMLDILKVIISFGIVNLTYKIFKVPYNNYKKYEVSY